MTLIFCSLLAILLVITSTTPTPNPLSTSSPYLMSLTTPTATAGNTHPVLVTFTSWSWIFVTTCCAGTLCSLAIWELLWKYHRRQEEEGEGEGEGEVEVEGEVEGEGEQQQHELQIHYMQSAGDTNSTRFFFNRWAVRFVRGVVTVYGRDNSERKRQFLPYCDCSTLDELKRVRGLEVAIYILFMRGIMGGISAMAAFALVVCLPLHLIKSSSIRGSGDNEKEGVVNVLSVWFTKTLVTANDGTELAVASRLAYLVYGFYSVGVSVAFVRWFVKRLAAMLQNSPIYYGLMAKMVLTSDLPTIEATTGWQVQLALSCRGLSKLHHTIRRWDLVCHVLHRFSLFYLENVVQGFRQRSRDEVLRWRESLRVNPNSLLTKAGWSHVTFENLVQDLMAGEQMRACGLFHNVALEPADVLWHNVGIQPWKRTSIVLAKFLILIVLMLVFSTPLSIVYSLRGALELVATSDDNGGGGETQGEEVSTPVEQIVSSLVLAVLTFTLPIFIRFLTSASRLTMRTDEVIDVCRNLTAYLVVSTLIVPSIASSAFSLLYVTTTHSPDDFGSQYLFAFSRAGATFFLNYLLQLVVIMWIVEFWIPIALIRALLVGTRFVGRGGGAEENGEGTIIHPTPIQFRAKFNLGKHYSHCLLVMAFSWTMSTTNPPLAVVCVGWIGLRYVVQKRHLARGCYHCVKGMGMQSCRDLVTMLLRAVVLLPVLVAGMNASLLFREDLLVHGMFMVVVAVVSIMLALYWVPTQVEVATRTDPTVYRRPSERFFENPNLSFLVQAASPRPPESPAVVGGMLSSPTLVQTTYWL